MTADKVTRRVYSSEELHRLRGTCSQPKLREAIEEHEGEDAELVKGIVSLSCTIDIICKQTFGPSTTPHNKHSFLLSLLALYLILGSIFVSCTCIHHER